MEAFKFLRPGAVGPFSGLRWPTPDRGRPGMWVRAERPAPALCRTAVHACSAAHLPFWLCEELWVIELEGPVEERRSKLVAGGGRLIARVDAWDEVAAVDFATATVERIRAMDTAGYTVEAELFCTGETLHADPLAAASVSTMIAVEAAEHSGGHEAVRRERAEQTAWLTDRLALS